MHRNSTCTCSRQDIKYTLTSPLSTNLQQQDASCLCACSSPRPVLLTCDQHCVCCAWGSSQVTFPASLTARQRALLHEFAEAVGLQHVSTGDGSARRLQLGPDAATRKVRVWQGRLA